MIHVSRKLSTENFFANQLELYLFVLLFFHSFDKLFHWETTFDGILRSGTSINYERIGDFLFQCFAEITSLRLGYRTNMWLRNLDLPKSNTCQSGQFCHRWNSDKVYWNCGNILAFVFSPLERTWCPYMIWVSFQTILPFPVIVLLRSSSSLSASMIHYQLWMDNALIFSHSSSQYFFEESSYIFNTPRRFPHTKLNFFLRCCFIAYILLWFRKWNCVEI